MGWAGGSDYDFSVSAGIIPNYLFDFRHKNSPAPGILDA